VARGRNFVSGAVVLLASVAILTGCLSKAQKPAHAAAGVLVPTADATVDEQRPATEYGLSPTLMVDDRKGKSAAEWSYLRFDLGAVPRPIRSAKLRMYVLEASSARPTVARASNSWSEKTVTWRNRPAPVSAAISSPGDARARTWIEWNVTSLLPSSGRFTLVLRPTSANTVELSSSTGIHPPQLVLDTGGTAPPTASPSGTSPSPTTTPRPTTPPTTTQRTTAPSTTEAPSADPRIAAAGDASCDP